MFPVLAHLRRKPLIRIAAVRIGVRRIKRDADQHQQFLQAPDLNLISKLNTMNQLLLIPSRHEELETVSDYPAVSIIMAFEPKMKSKRELAMCLNNALGKVEQQLLKNFQMEMAMPVISKLRNIIRDLDYSTHKKTIAIYVSPVFEKILYLNMEVEEKISVANSFTIRDLIKSKKEIREYLLLVLNENECKVYFDSNGTMLQVFAASSESLLDAGNQPHRSDTNFIDKYLYRIDLAIDIILSSFKTPLFVMGEEKIIEQFKNLTTHTSSVIQYIHHVYENISPNELRLLMRPIINNWPKVKKENLHHQLMHASAGKIVTGIEDVFSQAMHRRGRLLLVKKNYQYPSEHGSDTELIHKAIHPYGQSSYIHDVVDDVIEKVLEENGEVEFVDRDVLGDYEPIALIL